MLDNQKVPRRGSPPVIPSWVKVLVICSILLILIVAFLHLMGFGFGSHGASPNPLDDFVGHAAIMQQRVQQA